jgi:tetratricopeptide (TPR) repeat protein
VAHYRLGEFDQAANCFRRASQVDPNHPAPFNNLGHSFLQMERYSAAQRAFSRALQIDSNFGRSVTGLCIAMAHVGPGSEQGASLCRKAVILDPTSSSANYLVGYELLNRAQYREALPYFRRAVELEPSTGLNYLALGRALYGIGELDEAFKNLSRAAELQPGLAEAYTAKGAVHFRKRRFKEAIEEFKHAIELDPDSVAARYNLGVVCFAKGDRDCALQQYNRLKILTSPMGDKLLKLIFRNRIIDARSYPGSKSND